MPVARPRFRTLALILTAGMAATIAACGNATSDSVAIRAASERLIAASGNGAAGTSAELRSQAYAAVVADMQKVESGARNPGIRAAAAVLAARAMIGQGDVAAESCRDLRVATLLEIARLRSRALLRQDTLAMGDALSDFDPTDDLAAIDAVSREIGVEATSIRARVDELTGRIDEVRGQIGERMERSRQLREQDSTIRLASASINATDRAEAVTKATVLRREADQLEKRAAELELSAEALETQRAELQAVAVSLDSRAELLAGARVRVQESAQVLDDQAKDAARRADGFRTELAEGFQQLQAGSLAEMLAAHDEAISRLNSAAAKAGSARSVDPTNSALATAVAKQTAADLHRNVAQTLSLAVGLANTIGATEAATELTARLEEVTLAASEALDQAASAYQSVRVGRDPAVAESMEKLTESLQRDARRLRGEPEPVEEPAFDENAIEPAYDENGNLIEEVPDADEPAPEEPASDEPVADEPSSDEPAPDEPGADEPASNDPEPEPEPAPEPDPE
jgi:hypothetical protein